MSFLQQNQSQGQNGTCLKLKRRGGEGGRGEQDVEMPQTMYAHNNKKIEEGKVFDSSLPLSAFFSAFQQALHVFILQPM
jgi:hypothetical protein